MLLCLLSVEEELKFGSATIATEYLAAWYASNYSIHLLCLLIRRTKALPSERPNWPAVCLSYIKDLVFSILPH